MKKIYTILVAILAINVCFAQKKEINDAWQKYGQVLYLIQNFYVDTVNIDKLSEKAIISMLDELDPHSTYISKSEAQTANEMLMGSFDGIGIEFSIIKDTLTIISTIQGGPSEKVGIMSGDKIISADENKISGAKLKDQEIIKLLRGPKGTKVSLGVMRKNVPGVINFVVVRDKIPINSIVSAYEPKPGVGYIKLGRFSKTTMDEIMEANSKFKNKIQSLILDLRGNGGGIMEMAVALVDQFLEKDKLIVYTAGAHFPEKREYSTSQGIFKDVNLVVLIDEASASASEIVAGAIQDWDRGILVGRRTFGKGLVQNQISLNDGSFLRLTVSKYHTPTGRVIQRPYEKGNMEKYVKDYYARYNNGEVFHSDSIHFADSLKYYTLSKHRIVYGGGGIMPDIFVPADTTFYSDYYGKLMHLGILNVFAFKYVDKNRKALKEKYPDFETFNKNFVVDKNILEKLYAYAQNEKIERNDEQIQKSEQQIKVLFKAICARDLWGLNEYVKIINATIDGEFKKALDVVDNWGKYKIDILGK